MPRAWLILVCCLLWLLGLAWGAGAQLTPSPDPGLDAMKYRAIYGHDPPPPEEKAQDKDQKQDPNQPVEEPKPQYRWGHDRLLNPNASQQQGSGPATGASPYPEQPGLAPLTPGQLPSPGMAQPPGMGQGGAPLAPLAPGPSAGAQDEGGDMSRLVEVRVSDQKGRPVYGAQVTVFSGRLSAPQMGFTDSLGILSLRVPCLERGQPLSHQVKVSTGLSAEEQQMLTDRQNCLEPGVVTFVVSPQDRQEQREREYRQRQFLYQQEDDLKKAIPPPPVKKEQ